MGGKTLPQRLRETALWRLWSEEKVYLNEQLLDAEATCSELPNRAIAK
jgi:hypothetical protein